MVTVKLDDDAPGQRVNGRVAVMIRWLVENEARIAASGQGQVTFDFASRQVVPALRDRADPLTIEV